MNTTNVNTVLNLRTIMMLSLLAFFSLAMTHAGNAYAGSEGGWVSKQKSVNGGWKIENVNGKTLISFSDSFKTNSGPDLKLFLSRNDLSGLNGKNATDNAVLLAELQSSNGRQVYELPANININDYQSLIIHCVSFSVLWGGANI